MVKRGKFYVETIGTIDGFKITRYFAYLQQLSPCCLNIVFGYIIKPFILKVLQNILPKVF